MEAPARERSDTDYMKKVDYTTDGVFVRCLHKYYPIEVEENHTDVILRIIKEFFGSDNSDYSFDMLYNWCRVNINCVRYYGIDELFMDSWTSDSGLTSFECESAIEMYFEGE